MTPIYRSPDQDHTLAMQSLLGDHHIQTSVIETRKSSSAVNSNNPVSVTWYELWLRNVSELARANTIITQHEFTTFRTNMYSYRSTTLAKKEQETPKVSQLATKHKESVKPRISLYEKTSGFKAVIPDPVASVSVSETGTISTPGKVVAQKTREDLIPINNKRVFKRLGLLLGFSEEQIQEWDNNNKLYRPWDADELNESVKKLKQKCS